MLHGVHGNTTSAGPAVALRLILVVRTTSLEQGLVDTATASNDANHGAASGGDGLLGARWHANARLASIRVVRNDSRIVARRLGNDATVSRLSLHVADDGTLGHLTNGLHIADHQLGLLAAVDELARVHALSAHHGLLLQLESVRITEHHSGQRRTTSRVVDDLADDTLDVAM